MRAATCGRSACPLSYVGSQLRSGGGRSFGSISTGRTERENVERLVVELGLAECVQVHGHRGEAEVEGAVASAACLATASEREGLGLIVVEAAARGTPSVVVSGPENAATELVAEGINGAIAASAEPEELADAMLRVLDGGAPLRASTAHWFMKNAASLRIERSISEVIESYGYGAAWYGPPNGLTSSSGGRVREKGTLILDPFGSRARRRSPVPVSGTCAGRCRSDPRAGGRRASIPI